MSSATTGFWVASSTSQSQYWGLDPNLVWARRSHGSQNSTTSFHANMTKHPLSKTKPCHRPSQLLPFQVPLKSKKHRRHFFTILLDLTPHRASSRRWKSSQPQHWWIRSDQPKRSWVVTATSPTPPARHFLQLYLMLQNFTSPAMVIMDSCKQ